VKATIGRYGFLKGGNGSFGGERSGTQPDNTGFDPAKATPQEILREGYRRQGAGRT
jgi:hypothetical protein